jgi:predicted signal transduction protein with EAL and GGDEF domain
LLDAHRLPARLLTLEITETALVADIDRARDRTAALRGLCVAVRLVCLVSSRAL